MHANILLPSARTLLDHVVMLGLQPFGACVGRVAPASGRSPQPVLRCTVASAEPGESPIVAGSRWAWRTLFRRSQGTALALQTTSCDLMLKAMGPVARSDESAHTLPPLSGSHAAGPSEKARSGEGRTHLPHACVHFIVVIALKSVNALVVYSSASAF